MKPVFSRWIGVLGIFMVVWGIGTLPSYGRELRAAQLTNIQNDHQAIPFESGESLPALLHDYGKVIDQLRVQALMITLIGTSLVVTAIMGDHLFRKSPP